jgi:glycosyltransferase involved in cell wall biosynthesis
MTSPLVSIVMPVFNAERFVTDVIMAALTQSCTNLEVLVVDDGSTDSSSARIKQIRDSRLLYRQQSNQGQSAAINFGVALSQGEFIKVLDADDLINPEHIASQIEALNGRTDAVASCRWGYFVNDFRHPLVRSEVTQASYEEPLEWIVDSLTQDEGMMGGWMWLIPRQVWDRAGGYDSRLSLNNDFHFSIATLLASNGVCFAEDAIYSYRKGVAGALSGTKSRKAMESAFLTTDLGTRLLLERENSERIRQIAADRFQSWLFQFYPRFPNLVAAAESRIAELGGSSLQLQGGKLLKLLLPIVGWKGVRQLQTFARGCGWDRVLSAKARKRLSVFNE